MGRRKDQWPCPASDPGRDSHGSWRRWSPRGDGRGAAGCADAEMTRFLLRPWLGGAVGCSFTAGGWWPRPPQEPLLPWFWPRHPGQRALRPVLLGSSPAFCRRPVSGHGPPSCSEAPFSMGTWVTLCLWSSPCGVTSCAQTLSLPETVALSAHLSFGALGPFICPWPTPPRGCRGLLHEPQLSHLVGDGTSAPPRAPSPRTGSGGPNQTPQSPHASRGSTPCRARLLRSQNRLSRLLLWAFSRAGPSCIVRRPCAGSVHDEASGFDVSFLDQFSPEAPQT